MGAPAAHATAADSTRRARERAAALLVLVAQLDSATTVTVVPASRSEVWRAQLARESHALQIAGTKSLPADAHARVNALVKRLAVGVPAGAAGLRDPLGVAVRAARLDLQRLPAKERELSQPAKTVRLAVQFAVLWNWRPGFAGISRSFFTLHREAHSMAKSPKIAPCLWFDDSG